MKQEVLLYPNDDSYNPDHWRILNELEQTNPQVAYSIRLLHENLAGADILSARAALETSNWQGYAGQLNLTAGEAAQIAESLSPRVQPVPLPDLLEVSARSHFGFDTHGFIAKHDAGTLQGINDEHDEAIIVMLDVLWRPHLPVVRVQ